MPISQQTDTARISNEADPRHSESIPGLLARIAERLRELENGEALTLAVEECGELTDQASASEEREFRRALAGWRTSLAVRGSGLIDSLKEKLKQKGISLEKS